MSSAIQTHDLAKVYRGTQALHPLTLTVPRGAVFALVGHNGAGKTTLIKLLMNMIHPTSGSATILDKSTVHLTGEDFTPHRLRQRKPGAPRLDDRRPVPRLPQGLLPHLGRRRPRPPA